MFYAGKGLNERVSLQSSLEHISYLSYILFFVNHLTHCIEIFGHWKYLDTLNY